MNGVQRVVSAARRLGAIRTATNTKEERVMPAEFTQGFFVRIPAWHHLGVVLDEYPTREEAMVLAGHNWDIVECPDTRYAVLNDALIAAGEDPNTSPGSTGFMRKATGWKAHLRSDNLALLHMSKESFHRIPNSVPYDIAEAIMEGDEHFQYETGITLKDGALCALTLKLNEPIQIPGDDSPLLPFLALSWAHDGSGAVKGRSGTVRQVCANTVSMSEAEGLRLNTAFSIKHTKNWKLKIEDAKRAIKGARAEAEATEKFGNELAEMYLTTESIEEFLVRFTTPKETFEVASVSSRVQSNIRKAQVQLRAILDGPTTPDAHRETAWGAWNAAAEYLDHVRPTRGATTRSKSESFVQRTLLTNNGGKAVALDILRDVYKHQRTAA